MSPIVMLPLLVALAAPTPGPAPFVSEPAPAPAAAQPPPVAPTPDAAAAAPDKVVAVLDLKGEGDIAALANALATVMASDISARPGLRAVSRNELKSLLAHSADASLLGCDSANCAADVAKLVDAQLVVAGTLGVVAGGEAGPGGRTLVLTLSLIDPAGPAVVQRASATWRGAPEELVTVVRPTLDRLFDGAAAAAYTGGLELFAPACATVVLDGKELGTAPLKAPVQNLTIGVHVVQATGTGWVPARRDVVVSRNETTVVRVLLEEEPYYTQWWFWTAVGGGSAVALAAGTAVALVALSEETPPTRIVVKTPLPSTSTVAP